MSVPAGAVCPACHAAIAPGSAFCTRCGSPVAVTEIAPVLAGGQQWGGARRRDRRQQGAAPAVGAPGVGPAGSGGAPAAVQLAPAPVPQAWAGSQTSAPGGPASAFGAGGPVAGGVVLPHHPALGPAFDGVAPATAGRRVGAYAVDLLVVLAVASAVLAFAPPVYAALAGLEVALGLAVWEARSGRTPGNLALGLRTAKEEAPFAPGLGRAVGRALILGASHLTGLGQWLVVASSAFDSSGRGQAWHDRAVGTLVVDVRALRVADQEVADVVAPVVSAPVAPSAPGQPAGHAVPAPPAPPAPVAVMPTPAMAPPPAPPVARPAQTTPPPAPPAPPAPAVPVAARPPAPPVPPVAAPAPAAPPAVAPAGPVAAPTPPAPPAPAPPTPAATPARAAASGPPPAPPAAPSAPAAAARPAATAPTPTPRPAYYVLKLDDGQVFTVTGSGLIGRRPQTPAGEDYAHVLEVEDPGRSLSRTHARFGIDAQGFWIEDRGSANGTSVQTGAGWAPCQPGRRYPVPVGATVRLGDRTLVVDAGR